MLEFTEKYYPEHPLAKEYQNEDFNNLPETHKKFIKIHELNQPKTNENAKIENSVTAIISLDIALSSVIWIQS